MVQESGHSGVSPIDFDRGRQFRAAPENEVPGICPWRPVRLTNLQLGKGITT